MPTFQCKELIFGGTLVDGCMLRGETCFKYTTHDVWEYSKAIKY